MKDFFIERINIKDVRGIKDFNIDLDKNERKHLLITGKNGSGKTSSLVAIDGLLNKYINNGFTQLESYKRNIAQYDINIENYKKQISNANIQLKVQKEEKGKLSKICENQTEDERKKSLKTLGGEAPFTKLKQIESNIKSYSDNIVTLKGQIESQKQAKTLQQKEVDIFSNIDIFFSNKEDIYKDIVSREFILAYFEAKRENTPTVKNAIQNIKLTKNYTTDTKSLHKQFIEYMVKLRTDMLDAKEEGELKEVLRIEKWFENFENSLKELFEEENLILKYYRKELNFKIEYGDKSFGLNQLADGYSSLLAILTELILRMEAHDVHSYDMQGVVLIDEIETHLHVDLQKKVMPFLISFFPKIQFIVTTHSPFVLTSLSNAVVCDLEKRIVTSDLSSYSYDAIIESYFDSDKYSEKIKVKINEFELLSKKENLTDEEKFQYNEFKRYFKSLPTFASIELDVKIKQILLESFSKEI